jgi:hypothetical protein
MRNNWIKLAGFVALVAAVSFVAGQPPAPSEKPDPDPPPKGDRGPGGDKDKAPPKSKLEEMLERALLHNPDIRVAESKLREAEAELNRARLLVTQKVVTLNAALEAARANVAAAQTRLKRLGQLGNAVSQEEIEVATATLQQAKADLAKLEAEAPYITGQQPKEADIDPAVKRDLEWLRMQQLVEEDRTRSEQVLRQTRYAAAVALAQKAWEDENTARSLKAWDADKPAAERVRAALNKPVSLEIPKRGSLPALLALIVVAAPDLPIHVKGDASWEEWANTAPARFKDVPLAVVLQWFEDVLPHHRAYVRDYGVLYLSDDQRPPAGAVPLREFLRAGKAEAKDKPEKE